MSIAMPNKKTFSNFNFNPVASPKKDISRRVKHSRRNLLQLDNIFPETPTKGPTKKIDFYDENDTPTSKRVCVNCTADSSPTFSFKSSLTKLFEKIDNECTCYENDYVDHK
jgi:hypothetical protein